MSKPSSCQQGRDACDGSLRRGLKELGVKLVKTAKLRLADDELSERPLSEVDVETEEAWPPRPSWSLGLGDLALLGSVTIE